MLMTQDILRIISRIENFYFFALLRRNTGYNEKSYVYSHLSVSMLSVTSVIQWFRFNLNTDLSRADNVKE